MKTSRSETGLLTAVVTALLFPTLGASVANFSSGHRNLIQEVICPILVATCLVRGFD